MAQLAIKGHETRGKEVVEILKMLGGNTHTELNGNLTLRGYYIKSDGFIDYKYHSVFNNDILYSLEEFLEKFPYRVGDKVIYVKYNDECPSVYTIQGMRWIGTTIEYLLDSSGFGALTKDLRPYNEEGETFCERIKKTIDIRLFGEKETIDRKYNVDEYLKVWKETDKGLEVVVNDRFELREDNGKFYITKKQIQYPNTLEECAELLDTLPHTKNGVSGYYSNLLWRLQQLFICRNAYWKIAGDEMGLDKPWEPDWNTKELKYIIYYENDKLWFNDEISRNTILAFPTEEMRDAFYENFKTLIEQCKELL